MVIERRARAQQIRVLTLFGLWFSPPFQPEDMLDGSLDTQAPQAGGAHTPAGPSPGCPRTPRNHTLISALRRKHHQADGWTRSPTLAESDSEPLLPCETSVSADVTYRPFSHHAPMN